MPVTNIHSFSWTSVFIQRKEYLLGNGIYSRQLNVKVLTVAVMLAY